jgi:SAM-dependent methyltransferase
VTPSELHVGDDHARVTEPGPSDPLSARFEYFRHLFPYAEVARRTPSSARVLEVGCGAGYGAHHVAASVRDVTATDPSDQAIAYARANYPGPSFQQAEGTRLPFAENSFDAVFSFQVIEHIVEAGRYLREVRRVLAPGGAFYCTTPNRRLRLLPLQPPRNPYHVREYSDRGLRRAFLGVFREFDLAGVMARPDLMALEIARVRPRPLHVLAGPVYRRIKPLLPQALRPRAAAEPAAQRPPRADEGPSVPVGTGDFFLAGDTRRCLDLFCVARKRG